MNNIMSLPAMSAYVANAVNCTESEAEELIRLFFATIADSLSHDSSVRIKGLGVFSVIDEEIKFMPDITLADAVNLPFAAFEAVELPDNLDLDNATLPDSTPPSDATDTSHLSEESLTTAESIHQDPIEIKSETEPATEPKTDTEPNPDIHENSEPNIDNSLEDEEVGAEIAETAVANEDISDITPTRPYSIRWTIAIASIACILGFGAGYFLGQSLAVTSQYTNPTVASLESITCGENPDSDDTATPVSETLPAADITITDTKLRSTQSVITDTIGRTRFLTTMSRQHYGRMEFWVYIYKENASKLGNPNHLKAGTIVTIPPAEKYGINASDPASVDKAIRLGKEIYAQFN